MDERLRSYYREYRRRWRASHPEEEKALQRQSYERKKAHPLYVERYLKIAKKYREAHPERVKESKRIYFQEHKDEINAYKRAHSKAHPEIARARQRRRRSTVYGKLQANLRRRVLLTLKGKNKSARTIELIGCSVEFLKGYLEARFLPGMTWQNWSRDGWNIDHIVPCAFFDLSNPDQQRKCFHYSNLKPMWARANQSKGARFVG